MGERLLRRGRGRASRSPEAPPSNTPPTHDEHQHQAAEWPVKAPHEIADQLPILHACGVDQDQCGQAENEQQSKRCQIHEQTCSMVKGYSRTTHLDR